MGIRDGRVTSAAGLIVASALLALVIVAACSLPEGPSRSGPSVITFDGIYLGSKDSMGTEYPEVKCLGSDRPDTIVHKDRSLAAYEGDWRPYGRWDEPQVRMRLEFTGKSGFGGRIVEFSIGNAVYRSDESTALTLSPGWAGSATFEDVPLISGEPYQGHRVLRRLSIEWDCWVRD